MLSQTVTEMEEGLDSRNISTEKSAGLGDRFKKGKSRNGCIVYQQKDKEVA